MATGAPPPSAVLRPGDLLSHYRVEAGLGAGGMGTVYRARDTRLSRDVAIKVINPEIAAHPDRVARFHREARTVAALNHPGIVTIHDTGDANGVTFLVTELVDGATLRVLLEREGTLGHRRLAEIGAQAAEALAAAHAAGITHRDVKPENIMLTRDGRVKLLDFGLARSRGSDIDADVTRTALHTGVGVVLGTVGYMSPDGIGGLVKVRVGAGEDVVRLRDQLCAATPAVARPSASVRHPDDRRTPGARRDDLAHRPVPYDYRAAGGSRDQQRL